VNDSKAVLKCMYDLLLQVEGRRREGVLLHVLRQPEPRMRLASGAWRAQRRASHAQGNFLHVCDFRIPPSGA